jgi:hypothetical protein
VILAFVTLVLFGASAIWIDYLGSRRLLRSPRDYSSDVEIGESRLFFSAEERGKTLTVVGILKNKSAVPIRGVRIEVQVYDEQRNLVDSLEGYVNTRVLPGEAVSFKVADYRNIHLPEDRYASRKVFVREATSD